MTTKESKGRDAHYQLQNDWSGYLVQKKKLDDIVIKNQSRISGIQTALPMKIRKSCKNYMIGWPIKHVGW